MKRSILVVSSLAVVFSVIPARLSALMAGDGDFSPADSPLLRINTDDEFNGVGAISNGGWGTCTAISRHWVLTASHVVSAVQSSATLRITFHAGDKSYTYDTAGSNAIMSPRFATQAPFYDAALIYIPECISNEIPKYELYKGEIRITSDTTDGTTMYVVGYGASGYGDVGYATSYTTTDRRKGANVVEWLDYDGADPVIFGMDFDPPATTGNIGGSLGNQVETTFGSGDSGGPSFVLCEDGSYRIAGINTMIGEGNNGEVAGRFGSYSYGVLISSVSDWIESYASLWSQATVADGSIDWFFSPWYGWYYESDSSGDWIYSLVHGWHYVYPKSTAANVWILDFETGEWWATSSGLYPYFYNYADSSWYYFVGGVTPDRRFYSYRLGREVTEAEMP